jgi:hypothetical protein
MQTAFMSIETNNISVAQITKARVITKLTAGFRPDESSCGIKNGYLSKLSESLLQ